MAQRSSGFVPFQQTGVLVAEDQDRQWVEVEGILRRFGLEPVRAKTGYKAIRAAAADRPGLILLDGLLPGMHGFEVSRFIRQLDAGYRPYIVMVSGIYKTINYRNEAALKFGVDQYVLKPVSATTIALILENAGFINFAAAARAAS